ncbi:hypothetical protein [Pseudomonas juntendi]|uniref:Uncharacterized protein n=1 Tax=Pseudomonas juntendi TaxID=2666183 RepID=A0AAJ5S828_9PSED|nr:hypothetical protein [Pseudomonas juntendi]WEA23715.1 hypothetical protein PWA60_28655 [Pseudomonas juntendi]
MPFKRRTPEQFQEQLRQLALAHDCAEELRQEQQRTQLAAQQAELRGAMIMGMLYQQRNPGTAALSVYQRLSDPQQSPSKGLLRFLRLLGEA